MTNSAASHQVKINKISETLLSDTFLNIQKRRENIVYKSASSPENVNLSFVQSKDLLSTSNLSVRDRSTSLPENRIITQAADQVLDSASSFNIETDKFLVTNRFANTVNADLKVPLFLKHTVNYTLAANEVFSDIKVLDTDFSPVTRRDILVEKDSVTDELTGLVFSNLENTFNKDSGVYELFYITFLVKNTVSGITKRFTEIINNSPVFQEATVADLDEFGFLIADRDVYLIQGDLGFTFSVTLPVVTDYAVRKLFNSRLSLVEPPESGPSDPWFISAQNGSFIAAVDTTGSGLESALRYRIAEFNSQSFVPFAPFKLRQENSTRVSERIIKTTQDRVVLNSSEGLYLDVTVYDRNENVRFSLTADPAKRGQLGPSNVYFGNSLIGDSITIGTETNDSDFPVGGSSIDSLGGFIILPAGFETKETDRIETTYYYEEDKYEISFLNLNPLSDADILKQRVVIFIRPEELGSTLTQTLFYLVVNEDGQVLESNYNKLNVQGTLHDGLDVQNLIEAGQLWYERDPSEVSWAPAGSKDFIKNYSVEGDPNPNAFLILGEGYVKESIFPSSLTLNDIRVRGGGIKLGETDNAINLQAEAIWNWDIAMWDGYPYPGAASFFVEVPSDILEECGGIFTPKAVQGVIDRHKAEGVYPVVWKYNDYEPTITNVKYGRTSVTISWTRHPQDALFAVYTAPQASGPFSLLEDGITQVPGIENEYKIEVANNIDLYIIVVGRKGTDGPICFSGPVNLTDPGQAEETPGPIDDFAQIASHQVEVT